MSAVVKGGEVKRVVVVAVEVVGSGRWRGRVYALYPFLPLLERIRARRRHCQPSYPGAVSVSLAPLAIERLVGERGIDYSRCRRRRCC